MHLQLNRDKLKPITPSYRWPCTLHLPHESLDLQALRQRLAEGPYDLGTRVILVVGLDEVPGRVLGAGTLDHVIHRDLVGLPLLAVAVVFRGDLYCL